MVTECNEVVLDADVRLVNYHVLHLYQGRYVFLQNRELDVYENSMLCEWNMYLSGPSWIALSPDPLQHRFGSAL